MIGLLAVLIGACLQGSLGFGVGLVAAPVLVLLDPELVPGPSLCLGVPLTFMVAWRERALLSVRRVGWAILARFPGSLVGSVAVVLLSAQALALLFAVAILAAVGLSLVGLSASPTRRNQILAGFTSGAMGTSTSVGGPPIALLYQRQDGPQLRASLAAFMLFSASMSLVVLAVVGEFGWADARIAMMFIPAVVAGFVLSHWTNRILDNGYTRPAVLTFAVVAAVSIVVRQLV